MFRKWLAEKLYPEIRGDNLQYELGHLAGYNAHKKEIADSLKPKTKQPLFEDKKIKRFEKAWDKGDAKSNPRITKRKYVKKPKPDKVKKGKNA